MSNRIAAFAENPEVFGACQESVALVSRPGAAPGGRSSPLYAIGEDEFLPPEQAFEYTATADRRSVTVEWRATKGYYLYKKRMGLSAATPGVTVGESVYPKGEIHKDEYFGEQEVFRGTFKVTAPLSGAKPGDTVALKLKWQGCADAGLCYPPSVWDANGQGGGGHATTADKIFDRVEAARAEATTNTSIRKWPSCSRAKRCRPTTSSSTGASPTATTSTSNASSSSPPMPRSPVGAIVLPKGESHSDEYFGEQEIYRQSLDGTFSVPPGAKTVDVQRDLPGLRGCGPVLSADHQDARRCRSKARRPLWPHPRRRPTATAATSPSRTASPRRSRTATFFLVLAIGFLGGLLLAFTPCVLPMVPILSGIIAGGGSNMSPRRAFMLSVCYVAGMAVIYVTMGVLAGVHRQRPQPAGHVQPAAGSSFSSRCCSWCSRLDVRRVHHRDAELHPDTAQRREQPAAGRHVHRRRRDGRAVGAHRLGLRRAAAHRRAHLHRQNRRHGARRHSPCCR